MILFILRIDMINIINKKFVFRKQVAFKHENLFWQWYFLWYI